MNESAQRIVVVDLRIPFVRLVMFFIKAMLAAIPAAIAVGFLLMLVTALIAGAPRPQRCRHDAAVVVLKPTDGATARLDLEFAQRRYSAGCAELFT